MEVARRQGASLHVVIVAVVFLCGVAQCQNLAGGAWSKTHSDLRNSAVHPFAQGLRALNNTKYTQYDPVEYGFMYEGSVGFDTVGNAHYASEQGYHRISPNGTVVSELRSNDFYAGFYGGTSVTEDQIAVYVGEMDIGLAIRDWEANTTIEVAWDRTDWYLYGAGAAIVDGNIFVVDGHACLRQVTLNGTIVANATVAFTEDPQARSEFVTPATTGNGVFYYCTSHTVNTTLYAIQMPEETVVWKYDTVEESPIEGYKWNYYCSSSILISRDSSTAYMVTDSGLLFAFNALTGALNWLIDLDCFASYQVPIESPDGSIAVTCMPNSGETLLIVYGVQDGEIVHNTSFAALAQPRGSSAASTDGVLYGSARNVIYAFDLNTWELLWTLENSNGLQIAYSSFAIGNDGSLWIPDDGGNGLVSLACLPGYFIGEDGMCIECPSGTTPSPTGCTFDCGMEQIPFHLFATCDCPVNYHFNLTTLDCEVSPTEPSSEPSSEPSTESTSDTTTPGVCNPPCQNGFCGSDNTCSCSGSGYEGDQCQIPICEGGCIGECVAPGACACASGFRCVHTGQCVADPSECELPQCECENPFLCSVDLECYNSVTQCNSVCNGALPVKCWNGLCASQLSQCPPVPACPTCTPKRCSDGTCILSNNTCPAPQTCNGFICPDSSCVESESLCTPYDGCPVSLPIQCPSGLCVLDAQECNCLIGTEQGKFCSNGEIFVCLLAEEVCTPPPFSEKPLPIAITVSSNQTTQFGVQSVGVGKPIGSISVPSGAFGGVSAVLSVNSVADSVLRTVLPPSTTNNLPVSPLLLLASPAIDLTVSSNVAQPFAIPVTLSFVVSIPLLRSAKQYCLAYVEPIENRWTCEDTDLVSTVGSDGRTTLQGSTDHFTNFAVLFIGSPQGEGEQTDEEQDTIKDEGLNGGITIAIVVVTVVAIVAIVVAMVAYYMFTKKKKESRLQRLSSFRQEKTEEADVEMLAKE